MNRSSKGFGLAGVIVTVLILIVAAIFSTSAKSMEAENPVSSPMLDSRLNQYINKQ